MFKPNWTSLRTHQTPQWLIDAKFGIYSHISFDSVRNLPGNERKFTHELIEDFTIENFDAAAWAELFQRAGARFAGPVSWHGSGFVHWESEVTEFNAAKMGPKRDLVGELKREIEARAMKLIMSFHNGHWYQMGVERDNAERLNPKYADLYGPPHDTDVEGIVMWKNHIEKQARFSEAHQDNWLAKMREAVTKYQPDIAWMDVSFGGTVRAFNKGFYRDGKLLDNTEIYLSGFAESYQRQFIAHLFNTALEQGKEVEFVYKEYDVPPGVGMRNFENGLIDQLTYDVWMTDIDICEPVSWFYKAGMSFRDAGAIIPILVDVVSKNGILLFNVPPKADGTFAADMVKELHKVGDWLKLNGEAIYDTMPWTIYGEGPSALPVTGHYSEGKRNASYCEKDFRFTQNGDTLYAICLGVPTGEISIRALGSRGRLYEGDILSVELLGSKETIVYQQNPLEMTLRMPENYAGKYACVFKIARKAS